MLQYILKDRLNIFVQVLIFTIIFFSSSACKKHTKYTEVSTKKGKPLTYTIIDEPVFSDTSRNDKLGTFYFSSYAFINGTSYICYYDIKPSSIVVYDLNNRKLVSTTTLSQLSLYEDSLSGYVTGVVLHNLDSIFIIQDYKISLLVFNKIVNTWLINDPIHLDSTCLYIVHQEESHFFKKPPFEYIIMKHSCCWCTIDSTEYFSNSPIAFYNLSNHTIIVPPITYSALYLENYYGFKDIEKFSYVDSFTYISYSIDPNIYQLNNYTMKQTVIGGRSSYQKNDAKVVSNKYKNNSEEKLIDLKHDFSYDKIIFDEYRHLYYRFFSIDYPLKNSKGKYNLFEDRESVLMVFNDQFALVNEIKFPETIVSQLFVTKEGVYVEKYNKYKWKQLHFFLIKFS